MAKKIKVNLDEVEKIMKVAGNSDRKLANLPEDIGLWLYWRKITGRRVTAEEAEKVTGHRVSRHMVNNFFTQWHGIGRPTPFSSFKEIYDYLKKKDENAPDGDPHKGKRYKVDAPSKKEMEEMIEKCEHLYGSKVKAK